jgi:hypothetical protein
MGYDITRHRAIKELKVDQRLYTRTITERLGIDTTVMVPATAGVQPPSEALGTKPRRRKINSEDLLPKSSGGTYVIIDDDAARYLECGSHRGQIL